MTCSGCVMNTDVVDPGAARGFLEERSRQSNLGCCSGGRLTGSHDGVAVSLAEMGMVAVVGPDSGRLNRYVADE